MHIKLILLLLAGWIFFNIHVSIAQTNQQLVEQLGDEDLETRERASYELRQRGTAAIEDLEDVLDSDDPEVRARAYQILRSQVDLAILPAQRAAFSLTVNGIGPPGLVNIICPPSGGTATVVCHGVVTIDAFAAALGRGSFGANIIIDVDLIDKDVFGDDLLCSGEGTVRIPAGAMPGMAASFSAMFTIECSTIPPCKIGGCHGDSGERCAEVSFTVTGSEDINSMVGVPAEASVFVEVCCVEPEEESEEFFVHGYGIFPTLAEPGDKVLVELRSPVDIFTDSLLFPEFGTGIEVNSLEIHTARKAVAEIDIRQDAQLGTRDVQGDIPNGKIVLGISW